MTSTELAVIAATIVGVALVSRPLSSGRLSAAIVFVAVGLVLGSEGFDVLDDVAGPGGLKLLAEVTLALVLFADSSKLDTTRLRREYSFPLRLLLVGLPLTIALGGTLAALSFPQLLLAEAIVIAVVLAPTDAALGQAVVSDERISSDVRQGLNVESGLNDGICVPLLFAAIALAEIEAAPSFRGEVIVSLVEEVGIAAGVGAVLAAVVGLLVVMAGRRGLVESEWSRTIPVAVVAMAYATAAALGGSGFIACFVAGLVYGIVLRGRVDTSVELVEEVGSILSGVTFLLFAAVLLGPALTRVDGATLIYAVASLTVVRMLPVAASLGGAHAGVPTMAFAGWFGPRGLASIVFVLVVVEESSLPGARTIVDVTAITVGLSVVAHGVTASGLTNRYVRWSNANSPASGEPTPTVEHRQ